MREFLIRLACFLSGAGVAVFGLIFWSCLVVGKEADEFFGLTDEVSKEDCEADFETEQKV